MSDKLNPTHSGIVWWPSQIFDPIHKEKYIVHYDAI